MSFKRTIHLLILVTLAPKAYGGVTAKFCQALARGASFLSGSVGGNALPEFEGEPEIFRRLYISDQDVAETREKLAGVSGVEQQAKAAFDIYVQLRLRGASPSLRARVLAILDSVAEDIDSIYPGIGGETPRRSWKIFDWLFRAPLVVRININNTLARSGLHYNVIAHELEHVMQELTPGYRAPLFTDWPHKTYFEEFAAVRAEWEYWRLCPDAVIDDALARAAKLSDDDQYGRVQLVPIMKNARSDFASYRRSHIYSSFEGTRSVVFMP